MAEVELPCFSVQYKPSTEECELLDRGLSLLHSEDVTLQEQPGWDYYNIHCHTGTCTRVYDIQCHTGKCTRVYDIPCHTGTCTRVYDIHCHTGKCTRVYHYDTHCHTGKLYMSCKLCPYCFLNKPCQLYFANMMLIFPKLQFSE